MQNIILQIFNKNLSAATAKAGKTLFFFLICFGLTINGGQVNAQFTEDFESGNLVGWTQSPANSWIASSVDVISGNYSLFHNTTGSATAIEAISRAWGSKNMNNGLTIWDFQLRFDRDNITASNNWAIYLVADGDAAQMTGSSVQNAYVLGVNFSGTDDDVQLVKIVNGNKTKFLSTGYKPDIEIPRNQQIGLRIVRTQTGDWSIFIDPDGSTNNLAQIGATTNNTDINPGDFFGIVAEHSTTGGQNLWIDDIRVLDDYPLPEIQLQTFDIQAGQLPQQSANNPVYALEIAVADKDAMLNSAIFNTSGTALATDFENSGFKLWLSQDTIWDSGDELLQTISPVDMGNALDFSGLQKTIEMDRPVYLFLTVDVSASAQTGNTFSVVQPQLADLLFNEGSKTGSFLVGNIFQIVDYRANESDIVLNPAFTYSQNISYSDYLQIADLTSENAFEMASFLLRDGGSDLSDDDNFDTEINELAFSLLNYENIDRIALYQGTTELAEMAVTASTGVFNALTLTTADNAQTAFSFYISFADSVTDNQQTGISFAASDIKTDDSKSQLAGFGTISSDVSGNNNRIAVVADSLVLSNVPDYVFQNTDFGLNIAALDAFDNLDYDAGQFTLDLQAGSGNFSAEGGLNRNFTNGLATITDLQYDGTDIFIISAISGDAFAATNTQNIEVAQVSVGFEDADGWTDQNYGNWEQTTPAGTWIGQGVSSNSTPAITGNRGIGMNDKDDYLELPPLNNPGTLYFLAAMSSDGEAEKNKLALQQKVGTDWITLDETTQATAATIRHSLTANLSGSEIRLRVLRSADERSHYLDDFVLTYFSGAFDSNSEVIAPDVQVSAAGISSLNDSPVRAVEVFRFAVSDKGTADVLPTEITNIKIKNALPPNTANWTTHLAGCKLLKNGQPVITGQIEITENAINIPITASDLNIADGQTVELTLAVYLKNSGLNDGSVLQFKIDSQSHGWTTTNDKSAFALAFPQDIVSGQFTIEVEATKLNFTQVPAVVGLNSGFAVSLAATDVNGNIDTDAVNRVQLTAQETTSGQLTSVLCPDLQTTLTNGSAQFTDLKYSAVEWFQLRASDLSGNLAEGLSQMVFAGDNDSQLAASDAPVAATAIPSVAGTPQMAVPVFSFKLTDTGNSDGQPTRIKSILLKNNNPADKADWTDHIAGVVVLNGETVIPHSDFVLTDTRITVRFEENALNIADGADLDLQISIYLKEQNIQDNAQFQFYIDAQEHGIETYGGSMFAENLAENTISAAHRVEVTATIMQQSGLSEQYRVNTYFSWQVRATDSNGNTDLDNNALITLGQTSGNGTLSAGDNLSQRLVKGSYIYEYLLYDAIDTLGIIASANGLEATPVLPVFVNGDFSALLQTSGSPITASEIMSNQITANQAQSVFNFVIKDLAQSDLAPLHVKTLSIVSGESNQADWKQCIGGIVVEQNGVALETDTFLIDKDSMAIHFAENVLTVASDSESEITLRIFLSQNPQTDGQKLQFRLSDAPNAQLAFATGSGFAQNPVETEVVSALHTISVEATRLNWSALPVFINKAESFALQLVATDAWGNVDTDANMEISLSALKNQTGSLSAATGLSRNLQNGILNWTDLQFSDEDSLQLVAESAGFTSLASDVYQVRTSYFSDTFDNDLSLWNNTSNWTVNNGELQHNPAEINTSDYLLAVPAQKQALNAVDMHWEVLLKTGDWNPSSSNNFQVVLASDSAVSDADNKSAYVLGVNYSGTTNVLSLWGTDSTGRTDLIIASDLEWEAGFEIPVRLKRTAKGLWTLSYYKDEIWYVSAVNAENQPYADSLQSAAIVFNYSSTRAGLFYADNFRVASVNAPPYLVNAQVLSDTTVLLHFSEALSNTRENLLENTAIVANSGISLNLSDLTFENNKLSALVTTEFLFTDTFTVSVLGAADVFAAVRDSTSGVFSYILPGSPDDVIFNEIMADPEPVVGLPAQEYIELYNRSKYPVILNGWTLLVDDKPHSLDGAIIQPHSYLILCSSGAMADLEHFGNVFKALNANELANSGRTLELHNATGQLISAVTYTDNWYGNPDKSDGGWSLERIDPDNWCSTASNWTASEHENGGTPGAQNAVLASNPDTTPPTIDLIAVEGIYWTLQFSEMLDTTTIRQLAKYKRLPDNIQPDSVIFSADNPLQLVLQFNTPLVSETNYQLQVSDIADECGNAQVETVLDYFYYQPKTYDIVVNEIMADPSPPVGLPEWEYLELYNRSNYTVDMKNWTLQIGTRTKTVEDVSLPSGAYLLLIPAAAVDDFEGLTNAQILPVLGTTDLTNSGTTVVLKNPVGQIIDSLVYSSDWYGDSYKDDGGWALEKVDPDNNCNPTINWKAAENNVGGTPGVSNSIFGDNEDTEQPYLTRFLILSQYEIEISFSEQVDTILALNPENYYLDNANNVAHEVIYQTGNSFVVRFGQEFESGQTYDFVAENVTDLCANVMFAYSNNFTFYVATQNDLVFNELMIDPDPVVGLPEHEYIELYNITPYNIDLTGWTLTVGSSQVAIQAGRVQAGSYVVLCADDALEDLQAYTPRLIGLSALPTLSNTTQALVLTDRNGTEITRLVYDAIWYQDDNKKSGGYSLEKRNPLNNCENAINWAASGDILGGTPGQQNAIYEDVYDNTQPQIENSEILSSNHIRLFFDKKLDEQTATLLQNYTFEGGNTLQFARLSNYNQVDLYFQSYFVAGNSYNLTVNNVEDWCGNTVKDSTLGFSYQGLKLTNFAIENSRRIRVEFTEEPDQQSIQNVNNYNLWPDNHAPLAVYPEEGDNKGYSLVFEDDFVEKNSYQLKLSGLQDFNSKVMPDTTLAFVYYTPRYHDLVISEIMSNPEPVVGLPAAEYIEIFNRSAFPVQLSGLVLKFGSREVVLSQGVIMPDEYLIICHSDFTNLFAAYGTVLGLDNFPAITNSGQDIVLYNGTGEVVSAVSFSDQWHAEEYKTDGGWSLELLNTDWPLNEARAWRSSVDLRGGTPGAANSIASQIEDSIAPEVEFVAVIGTQEIQVHLSELCQLPDLQNPQNYSISEGLSAPQSVLPVAPWFTWVSLTLNNSLQAGTIYELTISQLTDLAGNSSAGDLRISFALPQNPEPGDLLLNEILFDSYSGGTDFVEMVNQSDKAIDLSQVFLALRDVETGELKSSVQLSSLPVSLLPDNYAVFSKDAKLVEAFYPDASGKNFIDVASMPNLPADAGNLVLLNGSAQVLDELYYNEGMHFGLLNDTRGVSLERVSLSRTTDDITNWHSAAETAGFATPGYQNSQFDATEISAQSNFELQKQLFSPDNDGRDDRLQIAYRFDSPGMVANITVYDSQGRIVRLLARNKVMGTGGIIEWDGLNQQGAKARIGIYIVHAEVFDLNGNVSQQKLTCVLGGKL